MPLGPGVRYRMKPLSGGGNERLAFKGSHVIEAKNMKTGAMHTPQEFAADRRASGMTETAKLFPSPGGRIR